MDKQVVVKWFSYRFMIRTKSIRNLKKIHNKTISNTRKETQVTEKFQMITSTPRSIRSKATDMFDITVSSALEAPLLKTLKNISKETNRYREMQISLS